MQTIKPWQKRLPTYLTFSRIAVAPPLMVCIFLNTPLWDWVAAGIFIAASITDFFDGYYARKYQAESVMGQLMDPVADKILVAVVLIMLIPTGRVDPFMVILFLTRDLFIGGIRSVAAAEQWVIAAKAFGKWKAALQMVAIPMILIGPIGVMDLSLYGYWTLWVSVILSVISGAQYIHAFRQAMPS